MSVTFGGTSLGGVRYCRIHRRPLAVRSRTPVQVDVYCDPNAATILSIGATGPLVVDDVDAAGPAVRDSRKLVEYRSACPSGRRGAKLTQITFRTVE